MNKQQLLKNLKENTYCRLGVSKIHGVGVFAILDIPKGTNPFIGSFNGDGIVFTKKELEELPKQVKKMIDDFFIPERDTIELPASGLNGIDISFYSNHSSTPNMKTDDGETFITIRDIKEGEELTYSYIKDSSPF